MPTYDFRCSDEECAGHGAPFESFLRHWNDPDPPCPYCHTALTRLMPAPKSIWMKPYVEYGLKSGVDPTTNPNYHPEGMIQYRTKNTKSGGAEKVLLRTRQEVKQWAKDEGLSMPDEHNPNIKAGKDGKTVETRGLAGQWV
jgi:hypothetical protein